MYILCEESPSAKKTPLVYEMDRRGVCPVCGEAVKTSMFYAVIKKIVYTPGHVISNNPNDLLFKKSIIISDRTLKGAMT